MKSIGFRIEGTSEQIEEALRRLRHVFHVSPARRLYDSRHEPEVKIAYVRCYTYEPLTLLEQLEAAYADIAYLQEKLGETFLEIDRLKGALELLPKPKADDAVLSPRSRRDHE